MVPRRARRPHPADQDDPRRIERVNRTARAMKPKVSKAVRRSESDDEVRANLPADLVPLLERVKRSIKAGPRQSRTEAFLEYAEEHPGEGCAPSPPAAPTQAPPPRLRLGST
jgi:hypothetical protein